MSESWPYNLPVFRRAHRALSPDGAVLAEIAHAAEVSMSNPTSGTLSLSNGMELDGCNPSFLWSDDGRYLAVPKYVTRFGVLRKQRMAVIDVAKRRVALSPQMACYFQPESFINGALIAIKEPFKRRWSRPVRWAIPDDLAGFREFAVEWVQAEHEPMHFRDALDRA